MKFYNFFGYSWYDFRDNIIYNLGDVEDVAKPPIRLSSLNFPVRKMIIIYDTKNKTYLIFLTLVVLFLSFFNIATQKNDITFTSKKQKEPENMQKKLHKMSKTQ